MFWQCKIKTMCVIINDNVVKFVLMAQSPNFTIFVGNKY